MRRGIVFGLSAYLLWGLFPLYWPLLEPADALEILAHRMVWSAVVMAIVISVARRWRELAALRLRTWLLIAAAAVLVSANWGIYIWAVNNDHVVDASLGYFINPMVSVLLGVALLRERPRPLQWTALGFGAGAVVFIVVGTGTVPWLALSLALSFGLYGLIKRIIAIPSAISLVGEGMVLLLPALVFLTVLQVQGHSQMFHHGTGYVALLVSTGLVTVVPLLLFGAAAGVLPLTIMGLLQYLTPITQFLLGVYWAGEQMSTARWAGFGLIWLALVVFTTDLVRAGRRRRRTARYRPSDAGDTAGPPQIVTSATGRPASQLPGAGAPGVTPGRADPGR